MKIGLIAGVTIVVILILVVCLVPIRDEAYAVTINYTEPATEYVALSYKVNDYMKTEIVEEYQQTGSCGCSRKLVEVEYQIFCLDVKNTDDVPGHFLVMLFGIADSSPYSKNVTLSLNVSEQKTAEYQAEVIDCCDWEIIPSVKNVETGEFLTSQREEIRYKKVTALQYLLYYK